MRRHKIKKEAASSSSTFRKKEENDLVYYIDDRVELMHQVFSLLKSKEIKSIAPECVKNVSIDDLEELCLEELLGMSSKRVLAVLDGAEPPSDTSSSDSEHSQHLETISLESLSSEQDKSSHSKRKNKRCKYREDGKLDRKSSKKSSKPAASSDAPKTGATVLELLELQARARAIRAQLAAEHAEKAATEGTATVVSDSADDDVIVKEEAPDVVELSTDDEKPDLATLSAGLTVSQQGQEMEAKKTVTKNNDLIIIKPQNTSRRIKLNRTKQTSRQDSSESITVGKPVQAEVAKKTVEKSEIEKLKNTKASKKTKNKSSMSKDSFKEEDNSDHDEITLELSDTEQMELEEFDRSKYNKKASVSSESDTNIDSANTENLNDSKKSQNNVIETNKINNDLEDETKQTAKESSAISCDEKMSQSETMKNEIGTNTDKADHSKEITNQNDNETENQKAKLFEDDIEIVPDVQHTENSKGDKDLNNDENSEISRNRSDGEVSDRSSSEVETIEVPQEVVCISDEENKKKMKKKRSKKDKNSSKKDKKTSKKEKSKDFNKDFYKDSEITNESNKDCLKSIQNPITVDSDENYELYEISDDNSSCYEVEGVSVLSKEPTPEEIEALSAKIDNEFERQEVVTEEEIRNHENNEKSKNTKENSDEIENLENISWKDRYLSSTKVRKVLSTSNILNAIRKKNIELKKKIEKNKINKKVSEPPKSVEQEETPNSVEEGTIEQFNTLQGSNKYVDPPKDISETDDRKANAETNVSETEKSEQIKETVPTEGDDNASDPIDIESERKASEALIRDARQLLKMYKKLLKECGVLGPNKAKKKKSKSKDKGNENNK